MKKHIKVLPLLLSIVIFMSCILNCAITVHADSLWEKFDRWANKTGVKIIDIVAFGVSQLGAVVDKHDFELFLDNQDAFYELWNRDYACPVVVNEETNDITLTKEFMAQLKALLDEYAKQEQTKEENGGFYLLPTTKVDDVPLNFFINFYQYKTFKNIVAEKGVLPVMTKKSSAAMRFYDPFSDPDHPMLLVGNAGNLNNLDSWSHQPVESRFYCAYEWKYEGYRVQTFPESSIVYESCSDGIDFETGSTTQKNSSSALINYDVEDSGSWSSDTFILYSTTGERLRVFVSQLAAQSYSVGNRKIYFSENYYNYVPEDLTVSIDDLQKSVDDLQKIIDELLKKINDQTSEKEIEELLRQILEELRKNPGGSGGGTGSGDVTVSVDLKETNSWLSKIYAKVSQIFDGMQKGFEDVVEQLKKIRNWTAVDTVIDGVDAVADWLDLIRDVLKDGAGSAVAAVSSALQDSTDLMKQKFPFSIPWDILFFVSVLSAEPETPHFVIPIDIDMEWVAINIHYDFVLDFSQFQWLSDLSRLLLSLTYAAGLMKKTVDIVSANKEG